MKKALNRLKLQQKRLKAPEYTGPGIGQLCLTMIQLMYVVHGWMVDYCIYGLVICEYLCRCIVVYSPLFGIGLQSKGNS